MDMAPMHKAWPVVFAQGGHGKSSFLSQRCTSYNGIYIFIFISAHNSFLQWMAALTELALVNLVHNSIVNTRGF